MKQNKSLEPILLAQQTVFTQATTLNMPYTIRYSQTMVTFPI